MRQKKNVYLEGAKMGQEENLSGIVGFKKGVAIYSIGDVADAFFYVLKGTIEMRSGLTESDSISDIVSAGNFFGAMTYFSGRCRDRSAYAGTDVLLVKIDASNFSVFLKAEPEKIVSLLNEFSHAITAVNESFLESKANVSGNKISKGTQFKLIDEEKNPVIYTDRKYAFVLPSQHDQFLFAKDVVCPVCDKAFKINQVRSSKLELDTIGHDFRRIYKGFDELWYQIWVCPHCSYAQFYNDFFKMNVKVTAGLELELLGNKTFGERTFIKHSINEVFEEHYHLNRIYDLIKPNPYQLARLWQSLAWLYTDVGDSEGAQMAKVQVKRYLEEGYYRSKVQLSEDDEVKLIIKLGILSYELGELREAVNVLLKTSQMKEANKAYKQKAQDLILEIKMKLSNQAEQGS